MAGSIPTYLTTQLAAQTAFSVPFGLLSLVNGAITTATAAGEFNVTVDCSLFVTEDVSNLRIYLDSLGYRVDFAKNTNDKSLNIDWGRFLDIPGTEVVVDQGTTPWIVAGTVTALQGTSPWIVSGTITTSPNVNIHDSAGNVLTSTGTSLDVNVTDFPAIQAVSQSGTWTTGRTWVLSSGTDSVNIGNFPATVAVTQGTSPWVISGTVTANIGTADDILTNTNFNTRVNTLGQKTSTNSTPVVIASDQSAIPVTGTITTSPNVNVHDGSGVSISSTGSSLNVNVTNTVPVTLASTTITGNVTVVQPSGTSLHVDVDNFPATQPVSGTVTVNQGTSPWAVSAASLPLPTGASTSANQTNGNQQTQIVQGGNTAVVDATGDLQVDVNNFPATQQVVQAFGSEMTYSFAGAVTLGLLATDVFTINGSNSKTIRILEIELFLERTTVGPAQISLIRRSANNTGGTSATFGAIAQDPNDPTSSGNVTLYTANPTVLGASPGNVGVVYLNGSAAGTAGQNGWKIEFLYDGFGKGVMLRNANQHIACNFGGVTVAGGVLLMNITWIEE